MVGAVLGWLYRGDRGRRFMQTAAVPLALVMLAFVAHIVVFAMFFGLGFVSARVGQAAEELASAQTPAR